MLKVCGIRRAQDLRHALSFGFSYIGFNFYEGSSRFVPPPEARRLWLAAGGPGSETRPAAVVVDLDKEELTGVIRDFPELQVIQAHGAESPSLLRGYREILGGRALWKAMRLGVRADVSRSFAYADAAQLILFDARPAASGSNEASEPLGGTGQRFPWEWLEDHPSSIPMGIAGGLTPGTLAEAAAVRPAPALLDLCSGVESSPGVKDETLIEALASQWRRLG